MKSSRIPAFYRLTVEERRQKLAAALGLSPDDRAVLEAADALPLDVADIMVENAVGTFALPFGVGLNFVVNARDVVIPMVVEEPSVIAAASNAARMVREGGGFVADADPPVMTAQIEVMGVVDAAAGRARVEAAREELLAMAHAALPRLAERGGGAQELEVRVDPHCPDRLIIHVHIDCRDAMGANMVNTVAEALSEKVARLAGGRSGLRILTNLCDRRCVRVSARVPPAALASEGQDGAAVRDGIVAASRFAEDDPYRAATHNKGIMNGVDAVVIATGNDWRGVEAGAHAFACVSGRYRPLATWRNEGGDLAGQLEMPMAVGTVGGTLHAHAGARLAQRILGVTDAKTLATIIASAGLASNLAALRALATDGIQRGHMALHRRSLGPSEGPRPPAMGSAEPSSPAPTRSSLREGDRP